MDTPQRNLILVVDDDKLMRGVLAEILRNYGYGVITASNGADAIEHLESRRVDLVITDLIMPQMSGIDLIRLARREYSDIEFVVITASNSVDIAVETMKAGASDYIVKPFHMEQIRIVVARALEMRRLREQAKKAEFYKHLAERDGLTGLLNYRSFQEMLRQELGRSSRYERHVSLLMIDVDKFKDINDRLGHPAGDRVLQKLAGLLDESCRDPDLCCRYGGEEFAIIAPETDKAGALRLAERIRRRVEHADFGDAEGPGATLSISVGVAARPADGEGSAELIEAADRALFVAKMRGRNQVVAFDAAFPKQRVTTAGQSAEAPRERQES